MVSTAFSVPSFGHLLEKRDRLLTADAGKVIQEFVQVVSTFEVLDKGLRRHPRAHEHRLPAVDLRVTMHDAAVRQRERARADFVHGFISRSVLSKRVSSSNHADVWVAILGNLTPAGSSAG